MKKIFSIIATVLLMSFLCASVKGQLINQKTVASESRQQVERSIAAAFAPVFYQGLGDQPRFDYITSFNFDRDWRGDNNWRNTESRRFPLRAYIYYSVTETTSHYFIHYAVFHPIDYKGGARRGQIFSTLIREGVKLGGKYDPTGRAEEAVLAHENDLEGCLVVVEKSTDDYISGHVVFVEALAHNRFHRYVPEKSKLKGFETVSLEGKRPRLFIEPKGHGIEAYRGNQEQLKDSINGTLVYTHSGNAQDPEKTKSKIIGYNLAPIETTLWAKARRGVGDTCGEVFNYQALTISLLRTDGASMQKKITIGNAGATFRGKIGAANMARPPWAWFDSTEREQPLGEWFFDPAKTIKRHFNLGDDFSTIYIDGIVVRLASR
jgi:hypothetical protein